MNQTTALFSVQDLIQAQAQRTPTQPALVYDDEIHRQIDYRSLDRRSDRLAAELMAMGVGPEVTVAICCERSVAMIVALLAVLKAGGCYLPLDPEHPEERLVWLLRDAGARVLLTQAGMHQSFSGDEPCQVLVWDEAHIENDVPLAPAVSLALQKRALAIQPSTAAYRIYTSGSTGTPKGVVVSHQAIANYAQAIAKTVAPPPGWHYAFVSTIAADLGLTALYLALTTGGCLHVLSRDQVVRPERFRAYFANHAIDCTKIVPSHLEAMGEGGVPVLPNHLLIIGGEVARPAWLETIREASPGLKILNHYGPTEAAVGMLTHEWPVEMPLEGPLPLGTPLAGTAARVFDGSLQPVAPGKAGELCIGGVGLARGYGGQAARTAAQFVPDPFAEEGGGRLYKTGDLAKLNALGQAVFLGRVDHQVKIRGFRIELGEIEAAITQYPGIGQALVVCREVPHKHLVAYIIAADGAIDESNLRRFLLRRLPLYMVPGDFIALETWPLTANGKIDRKQLPVPESKPFVRPETEVECRLASIWSRILGVDKIGLEDRFFNLGGDSVKIARLIHDIAETFGQQIPAMTLYHHDRLAQQARILAGDQKPASPDADFPSLISLGGAGDGPPLFLMHPISGFPAAYMHLQKVCPTPLVGTHVDLASEAGMKSYRARAARYAADIDRYQPEGPISVGGWSYGGRLAYEVAAQLLAKGRQVKHLIMFDSAPFHQPIMFRIILNVLWPVAGRLVPKFRTLFRLERDLGVRPVCKEELVALLTGRFFPDPLSKKEIEDLDLEDLAARFVTKLQESVPEGYWQDVLRRTPPWMQDALGMVTCFKIRRLNLNLIKDYLPKETYPGKITYFANQGGKRAQTWQRYTTEPVDVREYPLKRINGINPHDAMFEPENIALFAQDLNRILAAD